VRFAGAMLLANAAYLAIEGLLLPNHEGPGGSPGTGSLLPVIIDAGIGASLLTGNTRYRSVAVLRVVLGLFIFGAMSLAKGDYATAVAQVLLSSSLLAMLVGEPGKLRQGLSFAGFGLLLTLQLVGLYALTGGRAATAMLVSATRKDLDPVSGRRVSGKAYRYSLTLPSDDWFVRKDEATKKENPLADLWLTRPIEDLHVLVLAERSDVTVSLDAVTDNVLGNVQRTATSFKLVSREPIRGNEGRLLHYTGTMGTLELEWLSGVYTDGNQVVQVLTFGKRRELSAASADMRSIIESFRFDDSGQPQK
jgi:hypothetical protein